MFLQALNEARDQNQQSAALLAQRGEAIRARGEPLTGLRERMAAIAEQGAEISTAVKGVTAEPARRGAEVLPELTDIENRMSACVEMATQLHDDCKQAGFPDVGGQVDSMRQQLQSARNKVKLLREQLLAAAPN